MNTDDIATLHDYIDILGNDEFGEYANKLLELWNDSCIPEELNKSISKELDRVLKYYNDNTEYVQRIMPPVPGHSYMELVWKDE